jgi:phage terminase large subunit-like protein
MINRSAVLRNDFEIFARMCFRSTHNGRELGSEPYLRFVCQQLSKAKDDGARIILNMPPRHLKTSLGSVFLAAWLLARDPAEKILIVTYSEQLANDIAYQVRKIVQLPWFIRYFATRLAEDRTRVGDFATTAGGRVYAVSVDGSITGRGATIIIFDDPLKISDAGNPAQMEKVKRIFDTEIMSRLDEPKTGRVVINAHRTGENDFCAQVLQSGNDFYHIALAFSAPKDQNYDLGDGRVWHRKKGELLRPEAFTEVDVNRIKLTTINPDFEVLYQQCCGEQSSIRISSQCFGRFTIVPVDATVIISVDPGHRPGPGHSFTVMQAWCSVGNEFFLLDQWRRQSDVDAAIRALRMGMANCQPVAVVIEDSGYGPILSRELRRHFRSLNVRLISADRRSKTERLLRHADLIQSGAIKLPFDAHFRPVWDAEIDYFPHGPFDDQIDAMTLGLDFLRENPAELGNKQPRCVGLRVTDRGVVIFPGQVSRLGSQPYAMARHRRLKRIFPADE